MVIIKDTENTVIYNQSRTEAGMFNTTDLERLTRYTISVDAVNNLYNMSRSEEEFISIALSKFNNSIV